MSVPALKSVPASGAIQKIPRDRWFRGRQALVGRFVRKTHRYRKARRYTTDVFVSSSLIAGAIVGGSREITTTYQLKMVSNNLLVSSGVCAGPGGVSSGTVRDFGEVRIRIIGIDPDVDGSIELRPHG